MASPLTELNKEQQRAATLLWENPFQALQVVAGAGSGKTTTLVAAVSSAIEHGFSQEKIAVLTFSRRAAQELKERLAHHSIFPQFCGTLHALAFKILRTNGSKKRLILHAHEKKAILLRNLFSHYEHIPQNILLRRGFLNPTEEKTLEDSFASELNSEGLLDFDGMVPQATEILIAKESPSLFDVLFVDEYQDTSPDQARFIEALSPKKLFVVGDDWQSIYRFRGADVTLTRDFLIHHPNAKRTMLLTNYRSQKKIVRLGNRAIRLSKSYVKKKLNAHHASRATPVCYFTEAETAAEVWKKFCAHVFKDRSLFPEKTTVLVRTNAVRRLIEKTLPEGFEVMTIHKSKGLEFDNVLIFGIAEHIIPHRENDFDEEVRLFYVAMTRARHTLAFVSWEKNQKRSAFLPFLMRHCKLRYF